jgi:hypothetical protein
MSWAAAYQSKSVRKICHRCRARKARFQYRSVVKSDREHVLCFECYRSEVNRQRSRRAQIIRWQSSEPSEVAISPRRKVPFTRTDCG